MTVRTLSWIKQIKCKLGYHNYITRLQIIGYKIVCIRCGKVLNARYETLDDIKEKAKGIHLP